MDNEKRESIIKAIGKEIYDMMSDCTEVEDNGDEVVLSYCEEAVSKCLDAKADLIALLSKHPNWDEDNLRVVFDASYTRLVDSGKAEAKLDDLGILLSTLSKVKAEYRVIDFDDDRADIHIHTGYYVYEDEPLATIGSNIAWMNAFVSTFTSPTVTKRGEKLIKTALPDARIHAGQKATRALNKLLEQYGWEEKLRGKNLQDVIDFQTGEVTGTKDDLARARKAYTDYADNMNEITFDRTTAVSVNPMDFLRMSYGNSWHSCHIISVCGDYDQSGIHSAGCWSYAYDKQGIIFFTVEQGTTGKDITYADKYTRQMYFWNGKALLPSRVYPAEDNLDAPEYKNHRVIMEKVIADCTEYGNLWKKLPKHSRQIPIASAGYHYHDYTCNNYPIYSPSFLVADSTDEELEDFMRFEIGSYDAVCVCCGNTLDTPGSPICSDCGSGKYECNCCGDRYRYEDDGSWAIDRWGDTVWVCESCIENDYVWDDYNNDYYIYAGNAVYVDGFGYVHEDDACWENDFYYCNECGNWHRHTDEAIEVDGNHICPYCYKRYYETCTRCGEVHHKSDMEQDADGNWVCDDCIEEDEFICACCGRIHKKEDIAEDDNGGYCYCKDCYENRRHECKHCGKVYYNTKNRIKLTKFNNPEDAYLQDEVCSECEDKYYLYNWTTRRWGYAAPVTKPEPFVLVRYSNDTHITAITKDEAEIALSMLSAGLRNIDLVLIPYPTEYDSCGSPMEYNGKRYSAFDLGFSYCRTIVKQYLEKFIDRMNHPDAA